MPLSDEEVRHRVAIAQSQGRYLGSAADPRPTPVIEAYNIGRHSLTQGAHTEPVASVETIRQRISEVSAQLQAMGVPILGSSATASVKVVKRAPTQTEEPQIGETDRPVYVVDDIERVERQRKSSRTMATERELTDAKLEAVEARVETRLTSIEGKIDRLSDQFTLGIQKSVEAAERAERAAKIAEDKAEEARKAAGNTKWNILFTGLTVVAVVLAMWAIWAQGIEMVTGLVSLGRPPSSP